MRLRRSSDTTIRYTAVFDIGATSVGAGIARTVHGTTTLVWYVRTEYSYRAYDEYTRYERAMYSTLLEVGMKLTTEGIVRVREKYPDCKPEKLVVSCVFAPPWFLGAVGSATKTNDKPFPVDEAVLQTLEAEAEQQILATHESVLWHEVVGSSETRERVRQSCAVNGYAMNAVIGNHASSLTLTVYSARVGTAVSKQVHQILERVLPHRVIEYTTSTNLLTRLHQKTFGTGTGNHTFLVEVEGRITSVASVHNSVLTQVSTLPLGTNTILAAVAPSALSTEEARGKLAVLCKTSGAGEVPSLPPTVEQACNEWRDAVIGEVRKHSNGVVPAQHVFLLVGRRWYPLLVPILARPWTMPGIRTERSLVVTPLSVLIDPPPPPGDAHPAPQEQKDGDGRLRLFTQALFQYPIP